MSESLSYIKQQNYNYMKGLFLICIVMLSLTTINSQKYLSKNTFVKFYSYTPLEKIEAVNNTGACILDAASGNVELSALNTAFQFKKALMQQHFNENYMESTKFPKAKFKGKIVDISKLSVDKAGTYKVEVSGELNMHGVTKSITLPAVFVVNGNGLISGEAKFNIKPEDYNIQIPSLVKDNIAKEIEITAKADLNKM